jgi:hypothetical protein
MIDEGRWQNDIKEAVVKCKAEYGITQSIVFPNPTDLARVAVVSEYLVVLTRVGR